MFYYLLLLFTLVPLTELALLIWIGQQTSLLFTIGLVLVTGIAGAALARWQGWRAVARIQAELRQGHMPADALLDGLLILVAGLLLVTPGVLTDAVGFGLLVPPARSVLKRRVAAWLRRNVEVRAVDVSAGFWSGDSADPAPRDQIIDAQVLETRVEDAD